MDRLFEDLISAFGVSGHESEVRDVILNHLKKINVEFSVDLMGNIIISVGKKNALMEEKYMIVAHMDVSGFIVTYIEDNGFVRVAKVGEFDEHQAVNSLVEFENGSSGRLCIAKKDGTSEDIYIDLGVDDKEEALELVKPGDVCMVSSNVIEGEKNIISPYLSNRVGCYATIKALENLISDNENLESLNKEFIFVFSVQNNLGARGARAAAYDVKPMYSLVIDGECSSDSLGGNKKFSLGNGPAIKFMDRTLIMHSDIKHRLEEAFKSADRKVQYIFGNTSSDGATVHKEGMGVKTGTLVYPVRYMGTNSEMINYSDINGVIEILTEFFSL